jgi:hypothetical protein
MATAGEISDPSIKSPPRLLAEAIRRLIGSPPADGEAGRPVGTIEVQRAYLSIFKLGAADKIVVSVVAQDTGGRIETREMKTARNVTVHVSVQKKLANAHETERGVAECDDVADYSERVLRACLQPVTIAGGVVFWPTEEFQSSGALEEQLREWGQFSEVHVLEYNVPLI